MGLIKPIVIIGAARSGTTVLAKILSTHPDIAYLEEPNVIWKYRNANYPNDSFPKELATREIYNYINEKFYKFVKKKGKKRLLEKTPANSLRLAFVREILPKSKIIHVVRDGRDVALSARRKWQTEYDDNKYLPGEDMKFRYLRKQLIKFTQIPLRDMHYYIGDIFSAMQRHANIRNRKVWGPKFSGIDEAVKNYSILEICAMQWMSSIKTVEEEKKNIVDEDFYEVKYEDLCNDPYLQMTEILKFAELSVPKSLKKNAFILNPVKVTKWNNVMSSDELVNITNIIGDVLLKLGYE